MPIFNTLLNFAFVYFITFGEVQSPFKRRLDPDCTRDDLLKPVSDSRNNTSLALVNSKLADTRCIIDKDNKHA